MVCGVWNVYLCICVACYQCVRESVVVVAAAVEAAALSVLAGIHLVG